MKAKRITSLFLLCFITFGLALSVFSAMPKRNNVEAKAATQLDTSSLSRLDTNYEWVNGASINLDGGRNGIRFRYQITNPDIFKLKNEQDYASYEFTVYRSTTESVTPIYQIGILSSYGNFIVGHKRVGVDEGDESFRPGEIQLGGNPKYSEKASAVITEESYATESSANKKVYDTAKSNLKAKLDYTIDYVVLNKKEYKGEPFYAEDDDGFKYIDVALEVNSPYMDYFVTAKSQIRWWERNEVKFSWKTLRTYIVSVFSGEKYDSITKSPTRSINGVLKNMQAAGALEQNFSDGEQLQTANDILTNTQRKTVEVSYLEQIGKTPFAKKTTKTLNLPVRNNQIYYDDVSEALGGASLNCLGASVNGFEMDSFGNYTAKYTNSVRVEAKTADGNRMDYFLNIDRTFKEFYSDISKSGVFEEGLYSFMLNGIKQKYKACTNYTDDELYGLWGYVVVPKTTTFDSLFKDIFKTPTEFTGEMFDYSIERDLSYTSYTKLLRDYNYSWLETIWQMAIAGLTNWSLPATHYLFYADPDYKEVNIGENGGDLGEEGGAIIEEMQDVIQEATKEADAAAEEASRWIRVILATVLLLAVGFGVAYGVIKLKHLNRHG